MNRSNTRKIRVSVRRQTDPDNDYCVIEWFDPTGVLADVDYPHPDTGEIDGPFHPAVGWPAAIAEAEAVSPAPFVVTRTVD